MVLSSEEKRERKRIRDSEYYEKNKEKKREYRNNNKEYYKEYSKTPNGKKSNIINSWKSRGLICDDYDLLYSNYLSETHCDECRCRFGVIGDGSGAWKCLDHSHITGLFRNFLCNRCNVQRGE